MRPLDRLDYRRAVALDGPTGGIPSREIGFGDAGAFGEQSLDDFDISTTGGEHQRGHAILIIGIDRSSNIEEQLHRFGLTAIGRQVPDRNDVMALENSSTLIKRLSPEMRMFGATVTANNKNTRPFVAGVWPVALEMTR